jgi:hypothetical protein
MRGLAGILDRCAIVSEATSGKRLSASPPTLVPEWRARKPEATEGRCAAPRYVPTQPTLVAVGLPSRADSG